MVDEAGWEEVSARVWKVGFWRGQRRDTRVDSPVVWKRARLRIRRRWMFQDLDLPWVCSEDRRGQMNAGQRVAQVVRNVEMDVEDVRAIRES